MSSLNQLLIDVHHAFIARGIDHAFGGALALMHYVGEPRMTRDIDVNVFVDESKASEVLDCLSHLADISEDHLHELVENGFVRIMAGVFPIDVFLSVHDFHFEMRAKVEIHSVGSQQFPFISATHLAVLKALFDRPKDWVDILEMMKSKSVDVHKAIGWLSTFTSGRDERTARMRAFALARPSDSNRETVSFKDLLSGA